MSENPQLMVERFCPEPDRCCSEIHLFPASPADLVAAVRRGVESGTIEGTEPDYAAAAREYARTKYPNIKAIVDAALGDRLVIPVDGEES